MDSYPYEKLGGFLLAYVVLGWISVVASLFNVFDCSSLISEINTYMDIFPSLSTGKILLNVYFIIAIIQIIITVVSLCQLHCNSSLFLTTSFFASIIRTLSKILIIVAVITMINVLSADMSTLEQSELNSEIVNMVLLSIVGIAEDIIGLCYLVLSQRVHDYAGNDEYLRRCPILRLLVADNSDKTNV